MKDQGLDVASSTITFQYYLRHVSPNSANSVIRIESKEYKRLLGNRREGDRLREWDNTKLVTNHRKATRLRELSHSLRADFSDRTSTALPEPRDCDRMLGDCGGWVKRTHFNHA